MASSSYVYVIYIRSPQQKVWDALTKPEFQKQYWFGGHQESDWKKGSPWKMFMPEHGLTDSGEILESDLPNRVVIKLVAVCDGAVAGSRADEAYDHALNREGSFPAYPGRIRRMAARTLEPQILSGDRQRTWRHTQRLGKGSHMTDAELPRHHGR
jgi:uncharacterized protein YndB with AHSA1/START domain